MRKMTEDELHALLDKYYADLWPIVLVGIAVLLGIVFIAQHWAA